MIWVDCIGRAKAQPANKTNWPVGTMFAMTLAMATNFILIMTVLEKYVFHTYFYKIELYFLPRRLNNLLGYLVLFVLPCIMVNYLLIFRNQRYDKLIKKYPFYNGKLFMTYFLLSLGLPLLILWGGIFLYSK
jgi:glycosyltransferase involved in cell wall biosynthesis